MLSEHALSLVIKLLTLIVVLNLWTGTTLARRSNSVFTAEEKRILPEFRDKVRNIVMHDYQLEDWVLIPWLRAKNYNMQKSVDMLSKAMKWRKENNIDEITQDQRMIELKKINKYPTDWSCSTKNGATALISACGKWDVRKAMIAGKKEELTRWIDFCYESSTVKMREDRLSGRTNATQTVVIVDVANYNMKQHGCAACLPFFYDLVTHYEWYYPGGASDLILINVPNIFKTILDYMKSLMTKSTRESLHVFTYDRSEWETELFKHFDKSQLPTIWGGQKRINLN